MIKMMADASIANLTHYFDNRFEITLFSNDKDLRKKISDHNLLLCRSTLRVDSELLTDYALDCVATVSSGIDHIAQGYPIKILDAKGANARSVTDYVVACIAYCQLERYLSGRQVGIIGVGAVGSAVAFRLKQLGFKIQLFDPLRALQDLHFVSCDWQDLFNCDLICVHANLQDDTRYPSKHLLNAAFLSQLRTGTVIINAARGDIVDEAALLACPQKLVYCTDVYGHEPHINPKLIDYASLCTPHIAGHSIEAKMNALKLVSEKIQNWYGLPLTQSMQDHKPVASPTDSYSVWQQAILSIYNPHTDTVALKQTQDLETKFLELRKQHIYRHDFNRYTGFKESSMLQDALGKEVVSSNDVPRIM